jgi:hypothetical protein
VRRGHLRRSSIPLAVLALVAAFPAPAQAEIYRCEGADGQVRFSSEASACPGAKPHELRGEVQSVTTTRPNALRVTMPDTDLDEAEAKRWRHKRREAETELGIVRGQGEQLADLVGWCRSGGGLTTRDELGVKRAYSCKEATNEWERARARIAELEAYLDEGLEEECRQAGCLPGWIR